LISRLPIRLRLTLPFAAAMALLLAGMGLFVYLRVGSALLASVDNKLRAQTEEMKGNVEHGKTVADRDAAGADALGEVVSADGTVIRSTPAHVGPLIGGVRLRRVLSGERVGWSSQIVGSSGRWRLRAVPARTGRGVQAVVAAASLTARDEALDRLAREFLIGGVLALLVTIVGGYVVATAALRPVEAMRARAAAITAATPGRRLPVPDTRDELARLAETLNDMLARLESAFEHERRFVADASHELRTPLTMLRTELDLALRRPRSHDELEQAVRSASEETERLSRLAEDLLLIARSDQGRLPVRPAPVDVVDVLTDVAERYASVASEQGRSIKVGRTERVTIAADRTRVEQALNNLVSNAIEYGGGSIELVLDVDREGVELHVLDEGKGFAPAYVPRAFDRFSRADEARGSGGAGLGLAIVELIAVAHGGSAGVANRDGHGADAWIRLPREFAPTTAYPSAVAAD
jgi:heavy metal sensor kinase